MEYRQLGRSGLRVSQICLGTMVGFKQADQENATRVVHEAIDLGITFIDTADCYGESEVTVGNALADGGMRDRVVLATKECWYMGDGPNDFGASRKHIVDACEASLRRLQTDYIDLYIIHVVDPTTPLDETLRALDDLVRQGKVRYIGTSKHPATRLVEAVMLSERCGWERFVSEQPPYNLLDRNAENELIPACMRHGIAITPFYPLASGLLSGKYRLNTENPEGGRMSRRKPDQDCLFTTAALERVERLLPIAQARGVTLAELSLAWMMQQPGVAAPVVGMRTVEYVRSGVAACEIELTDEELAQIDEAAPPGTYVSNYYEPNVFRPLRMGYAAAARKIQGAGAYIPMDNPLGGKRR